MEQLPASLTFAAKRELPYATHQLSSGNMLITGYFGGWCILTSDEWSQFSTKIQISTPTLRTPNSLPPAPDSQSPAPYSEILTTKLETAGVLISSTNLEEVVTLYRDLHRNLFLRPSLHIINTTNTCNYRCTYCHAGVSQGNSKMSTETAKKVASFILEHGEDTLTIEFQGGEALLNWDVLTTVTEEAKRLNTQRFHKHLNLCVVSNLSLLTPEKLDYLIEHEVSICTSLDGPAQVHNANRLRLGGAGTFEETISKIKMVQSRLSDHGKPALVGALCTVTRHALPFSHEIVDLYRGLGLHTIHFRALNNLGDALAVWKDLNYTGEQFAEFWTQAMDYIIDLNKHGEEVIERGALFIIAKVLGRQDPLYTEMMSPCGAGRGQILYNHDGSIFTCDEGRMLFEDIFKIGDVTMPGKDVLSSNDLLNTWAASFLDLTCYQCAFRPWCGTCPVVNYQTTKNVVPNIPESFWHKVYWHQFTYIFNKIDTDPQAVQIFKNWLSRGLW